jgi:hypothetical protein
METTGDYHLKCHVLFLLEEAVSKERLSDGPKM